MERSWSWKAACEKLVLDPRRQFLQKWNKIVLISCAFTVAWDALFLYIPIVDGKSNCLEADYTLEIIASVSFGRGDLVKNLEDIATRYLKSYFIVDVVAVLPLPQMAVLAPRLGGNRSTSKDFLTLVIFTQYLPRLLRVYPLYKEVTRTSGVVTAHAWAGAVLNLLLYLLASHVLGAVWYLFSIDRLSNCWHQSCTGHGCLHLHAPIYCRNNGINNYTLDETYCSLRDPDQAKSPLVFDFGMFYEALHTEVLQSRKFSKKISLCFWWGLRSLSSFGQNFKTSNYVGENLFSAFICISGLVLFSFLFGNIKKYIDSATAKVEEMRLRRHDTDKWMSHRSLPENLKKKIRKYEQYKWQETRGVDEETVITKLPRDLRTEIKRHLLNICYDDPIISVPWFRGLNEEILDAMCEWLKPIFYMENSLILRQGRSVQEVLFLMRGNLISRSIYASSGFTTVELDPGDYCGSELLMWAADPKNSNSSDLPISHWTVESRTVVEGFVLKPDELRLLMKDLRMFHGQTTHNLQYEFKAYSRQCKTWATCRIQAEWRRHKKQEVIVKKPEDVSLVVEGTSSLSVPPKNYLSKFADTALQNLQLNSTRYAGISQAAPPSTPAPVGAQFRI